MGMTVEQKRALALARARMRLQKAESETAGMSPDIGASIPDVAVGNGAQRQFDNLPMWAKPIVAADDLASLALNGITSGFGDKALAGLDSLIGRGSYEDQLATRRKVTEDARTRAGVAGAVAEIGGAVLPAAKLAKMGVTATRIPGAMGRLGGMAIDGAAFGAVNALGNDQNIGTGAAIGAGLGAGGQAIGNVVGTLAKPFMARLNPKKATQEVLLKAMDEAGTNPAVIAQDLASARADGQTSYALMDAMGYPGERLASTVVRTPSDGRTPMVEFLENRQAGQGRRTAAWLSEGFGDPATALKRTENLKASRKASGDINYTNARNSAGSVNTGNVLAKIDSIAGKPVINGRVIKTPGLSDDTIAGTMARVRSMLVGSDGRAQLIDFDTLLRVRKDIGDMAQAAFNSGKGNQYSSLKSVVDELDKSLAKASGDYRKALTQYAKDSKIIDAVDTGRAASQTGRFEDTIPAYQKMIPEEQAAFRAGYGDPLIAQTQGAAVGANKVRPLINDAYATEFPAFAAPGKGDQLGRRIAREQTMFDRMAAALRGSKTANNLADDAELSIIDPSVIGNLLSGNVTGAVKNALLQGMSALKGQPPAVRKMLSEALRVTDSNMALQNLEQAVSQIKASQQQKQAIIRAMMLLGTAGALQSQK